MTDTERKLLLFVARTLGRLLYPRYDDGGEMQIEIYALCDEVEMDTAS